MTRVFRCVVQNHNNHSFTGCERYDRPGGKEKAEKKLKELLGHFMAGVSWIDERFETCVVRGDRSVASTPFPPSVPSRGYPSRCRTVGVRVRRPGQDLTARKILMTQVLQDVPEALRGRGALGEGPRGDP